MFSSFTMGPSAETYEMELTYEAHATMEAESVEERATKVTFDSREDPEEVIDALMKQRQDLPYETGYDYVVVRTLCSASSVAVQLSVEKFQPKPVALKVSLSGKMTTSASHAGLAKVLKQCQLGCLRRLSVHDGLFAVVSGLRDRWNSIRSLDASNNALETLPKGVFANFPHLEVLRLDRNRLTTLPNLNSFTLLKELHVNDNALTALPIDLVEDLDLEVLSLEFNRLNKLHVKLKDLSKLRALCLLENPIETLPRLNKSGNQRCLSLANVKVWKDEVTGDVDVKVQETGSSYFSSIVGGKAQKDKAYTAFLNLIFRSSECQNSLLVAAVKAIASKSRENCEAIVNTEGALNHLINIVYSSNNSLMREAAQTLGHICGVASLSRTLLELQVENTVMKLIQDTNEHRNRCGLIILNGLVGSSHDVARSCYSDELIERLTAFVAAVDEHMRLLSLRILGKLAFEQANRRAMLKLQSLHSILVLFALRPELKAASAAAKKESIRVLAILGENELVRQATGRPSITGRGIRILALDGGGIRGRATLKLLERIEAGTGRPIHESFDLVCGTSTGAVLATAACIKKHSLKYCDEIYLKLGRKIFSQTTHEEETAGANSWLGSVGSIYTTGKQQLLATTLYSSKHDTSTFETLVRQECKLGEEDPTWIDTASLGGPKVCCVSTQTSQTPAMPYLFRNYAFPASSTSEHSQPGSCEHLLWQGVCASAAAPYYLYVDAFAIDSERWVDGAMTCNNPAMMGVQEARRLWPDKNIECVVSLGSGHFTPQEREPPISLVALAKDVLFDSACNTERVHESLETLLPLIPGAKYFRFNPVDLRCKIEVDETDIGALQGLINATTDYIGRETEKFDEVCHLLRDSEEIDEVTAKLLDTEIRGGTRSVIVVQAPRYEEELSQCTSTIESFCTLRSIPIKCIDCAESSGSEEKNTASCLQDAVSGSQAAVIHFNCHADSDGLILAWQKDMNAIAEPSSIAELFMEKSDSKYSSIGEHCETEAHIEVQGMLHTFSGKHVQANANGERTTAYLFERIVPLDYLDGAKTRELFGVWCGKIIVCQSSPPRSLVMAWLEAGAKCVIAPCRDNGPVGVQSEQREFMAAFYHALFVVGADATAAMSAAAIVQPACAYYRCHVLVEGEMIVLGPDEEFDFPLDASVE